LELLSGGEVFGCDPERVWFPMVLDDDIQRAARLLREGRIVAFPTETVYGLGANAWDEVAVAHIFELKGRPRFDPLIVHVGNREQLLQLVSQVPQQAQRLIDRYWPGPLTVVLPKQPSVPDIVTAGLDTVAVRQPSHPIAQRLLQAAGVPVAAPSANRFGSVSPTTADHVREQFQEPDVFILDGGPCPIGVESTVVGFEGGQCVILRHGGVPLEELESHLGESVLEAPPTDRPRSPGQLSRHYAPRTPLIIEDKNSQFEVTASRAGLLALQATEEDREKFAAIEELSPSGDLRQAAARLFAALRKLDRAGLDVIVARPVPEIGLGRAIMDRLRRASTVE
jgi:L-threonylcarbamoyladenylate synthase